MDNNETEIWIDNRKQNNGFKEQMWVFFSEYHEMIFNGQNYFDSSIIDLCGEII